MDRVPIYLESDDEITSAVDKLKNTEGVSLDIVIPKDAIMLQSVINLKLLKRQAETLGKEITIVTTDKVGQKLAEQIGIPVVAKEGQTPKEVNMSEIEKPTFSEEDIEVKNVEDAADANIPDAKDAEVPSQQTAVAPAKEAVEDSKPKKKSWLSSHKKGAWIAAGFGVLALAVLAYVYVPLANITLRLAAEKKALDLTFVADKAVTEVNTEENKIPAREAVQELEREETFQATGKKDVGEKATGTATIYNNGFDSDPITIVAGTRLVTSGGLIFRTNTNVTLPGSYLDGGNIVTTSVDIAATAEKAGEKYNIAAASSLSVPALNTSKIYAKSKTAFSGGTTKEVTYITAADIKGAEEKLSATVDTELKSKLSESVEDDETLLEEASSIEKQPAVPSSPANTEAAEFKLKMKAKITALVFKQGDLLKLAEGVLSQEIGSTKEIVEKDSLVSEAKTQKLDLKAGTVEATLAGEAYIATKINQDDLRNSINGDPESVALEYLNDLEGVDEAEFRFFPSFYRRVPRINSHIYFKTEINKTQE